MPHLFKIGDRVSLAFGFHDQNASGTYPITRLLPPAKALSSADEWKRAGLGLKSPLASSLCRPSQKIQLRCRPVLTTLMLQKLAMRSYNRRASLSLIGTTHREEAGRNYLCFSML